MTASEPDPVEPGEERRRRAGWIKLGIAGLAILGIGGVLTTAAWQQQAVFRADAEAAASVVLEAAKEKVGDPLAWDWKQTAGGTVTLTIDNARLQNMVPSATPIEIPVAVRNAGTDPIAVTIALDKTGDLFTLSGAPTVAIDAAATPYTLNAAQEKEITISVTPGATLAETFQGTTGTLTVTATAVPAP